MKQPKCPKCQKPLAGYVFDDSIKWKCGLSLCKNYMVIVSSTPLKDLEAKE